MLGRAVAQARGPADHPGAGRVGTGETSRPGLHPHTRHARPRRQEVRTARPTEATGHRAPHVRPDLRPTAATAEAARDMSGSLSSGVPGKMPQATQAAGRSRVTRLFSRATDRAGCRERRESDEGREAPGRTKRVWPEREESPAGRQREVREGLAPNGSRPGCGPGLPDGRGDARRLRTGDGRGGEADARRGARLDGAPRRPRDEGGVARAVRERR